MKGYFKSNPFTAMSIPEEEGCSSSSISPHMEEDPLLTFSSSQSSFYIPTSNQSVTPFVGEYGYYPSQSYHGSTSDTHPPIIYADPPFEGHPFFPPTTVFTTTPSPSSSLSSSSFQGYPTTNNTPNYYNTYNDGGAYPQTNSESSSSDFENDKKKHQNNKAPSSLYSVAPGSINDESRRNSVLDVTKQHNDKEGKKSPYSKRQVREKNKKRCSNCHASSSPSWRRSISKYSKGELLCNACGLYEKTAKKKRMLVTHEDGNIKVVRKRDARDYSCSACHVKDVTLWRRSNDTIKCERCARRPYKL